MRRQIKQKNRCASHQKRSIVRPMLSVMAIQIALTAEELGKIVSAGIPSIGTRKAIYQLTVYFAKETVAFCMFLLAQPACGTPRQRYMANREDRVVGAQPACGTPRQSTTWRMTCSTTARHNLRAVRRGKEVHDCYCSHSFVAQPACGTLRKLAKRRAWPVFLVTSAILSENRQFFRFGCCSSAKNTV